MHYLQQLKEEVKNDSKSEHTFVGISKIRGFRDLVDTLNLTLNKLNFIKIRIKFLNLKVSLVSLFKAFKKFKFLL